MIFLVGHIIDKLGRFLWFDFGLFEAALMKSRSNWNSARGLNLVPFSILSRSESKTKLTWMRENLKWILQMKLLHWLALLSLYKGIISRSWPFRSLFFLESNCERSGKDLPNLTVKKLRKQWSAVRENLTKCEEREQG